MLKRKPFRNVEGELLQIKPNAQRQEINETDQQWFETNYANSVEGRTVFHHQILSGDARKKASMRRKDTSPRFDANAAAISRWTQGVQIGPVLDVVVLKKASHLFVIEVRVPSRSLEHRPSCVAVCQDSQHYAHRKVVDDVAGANPFLTMAAFLTLAAFFIAGSLLLSETEAADDGTRRQRRKVRQRREHQSRQ